MGKWTEKEDELLKEYLAKGYSAAQIAAELTTHSRNAVIGRWNRQKMKPERRVPDPAARKEKEQMRRAVYRLKKKELHPHFRPSKIQPPISNGGLVSIMDLQSNMCRYLGDDLLNSYCGAPTTEPSSSWCEFHKRIVFESRRRSSEQQTQGQNWGIRPRRSLT